MIDAGIWYRPPSLFKGWTTEQKVTYRPPSVFKGWTTEQKVTYRPPSLFKGWTTEQKVIGQNDFGLRKGINLVHFFPETYP